MMVWILEKPVRWIIGGAIVFLLFGFVLNRCASGRQEVAVARVERETGKAGIESARDAIGAVEGSAGRSAASDQLTRENERAIHNAKGAADVVAPDVAAAGLHGLCRRAAYRDSPECVQRVDPR